MAQLAQQAQAQLRQLLLGRDGAEGGAAGVRTGSACLPTVKRSGTSLAVTGVCLEVSCGRALHNADTHDTCPAAADA